ncbi:MAG: peroxidase [Planctomycetes bacterium]|nr:peroxidase [Planctomycetota bacterium]
MADRSEDRRPWIEVHRPEEIERWRAAHPQLAAHYDAAIARAGKVFGILQIQSLNPGVLGASIELYRRIMFGPSGLTRAERESLAVVVSSANHCHY